MTALPIVETQAGDISAYIPTNVISITDGQLFLAGDLFYSGQRPAVNVGLSVSRVGGAAQTGLMKKAVGSIRLDLAQYREMQVFSQFGSELDEQTAMQLKYGAGLMQLLRQPTRAPLSMRDQVILLLTAQAKYFLDIPPKEIAAVKRDLLTWFEQTHGSLCLRIDHATAWSDKLKTEILAAAEEFFSQRAQ